MYSVLLPSSLVHRLLSYHLPHHHQLQPRCISTSGVRHPIFLSSSSHSLLSNLRYSLNAHWSSVSAALPSDDERTVSVMKFEDFIEKDWSFLNVDNLDSEEHKQKISEIISAGEIEETSQVLVSIGSEDFVDQVVNASPSSLVLVAHDSLLLLAIIKEKYDKVKCWQGEVIHVPKKWAPLDVVFLYFLPALPFKLDEIFATLAQHCSQGARVVISHPQGREVLEQQKKQYQDVIVSELPDKMTLHNVAACYSFQVAEYVDKPGFYLAVLRFSCQKN